MFSTKLFYKEPSGRVLCADSTPRCPGISFHPHEVDILHPAQLYSLKNFGEIQSL